MESEDPIPSALHFWDVILPFQSMVASMSASLSTQCFPQKQGKTSGKLHVSVEFTCFLLFFDVPVVASQLSDIFCSFLLFLVIFPELSVTEAFGNNFLIAFNKKLKRKCEEGEQLPYCFNSKIVKKCERRNAPTPLPRCCHISFLSAP